MSFITKKLEEFDERFKCIESDCNNNGIRGVFNGEDVEPVQCQFCYEYRFPIKQFLLTAIDEMIKEVEKGLPEEASDGIYGNYKDGFDDCLEKAKQSLSSLREGNK